MDYRPRYPQPFTFEEAVHLDVPVISEEISRLQNSLVHLASTQEQLREAHEESPDPDFEQAIQENEDVIGSQQERISILRMALAEKGVPTSCRQELEDHAQPVALGAVQNNGAHLRPQEPDGNARLGMQPSTADSHDVIIDEDGGIDL